MRILLSIIFAIFSLAVQAQNIQPTPGDVLTYLGPSFGADWRHLPSFNSNGAVVVYPSTSWTANSASTVAWTIVPPVGHVYTCLTTSTQCFQEILDQAFTQGDSIEYRCPGEPNPFFQTPYISANANVNTHALVQRSLRSFGCNITFAASLTGFNFRINTMLDGATLYWDGQVVNTSDSMSGSDAVVAIAPNECPPAEGCGSTVVQDSEIFISAVVTGVTNNPSGTGNGSLVRLDAAGGSIIGSHIDLGELNGCGPCTVAGARVGFAITSFNANSASGRGVFMNTIKVKRVHNVNNGIQIGANDGNQQNYSRNKVSLSYCNLSPPSGTSGACFNEYGYFNDLEVLYSDNTGGSYASVVNFQSGSVIGRANVHNAIGYTNADPIVDNGSGHSYSFNGNILQEFRGTTDPLTPGTQYNYHGLLGTGGQAAPMTGTHATNSVGMLTFTGGPSSATILFSHPYGTNTGSAWQRSPWCDMSPTSGFIWTLTAVNSTSATFTPSGSILGGSSARYTCSGQQ